MGETKVKFNALTPEVLEENAEIYNEALDYAFSNSDIKNIAITGNYGAGKTTAWRTYVNHKNIENIITVSLGKYEDNVSKEQGNISNFKEIEEANTENRIERQVINQILSQVKSKNIPLSKYKFKENKNKIKIAGQALLTVMFIISIISWFGKDDIQRSLNQIIELQEPIKHALAKKIELSWSILSLLFFLIPLIYFLYGFFRENNFKLSKINIKGAEANLKDCNSNDETILDRDIKEIVYILKHSDTNIVVFEDLDRYDNLEIFTKLRELNFMINANIKAEGINRIIRFFYMLRDGMFHSKNRVKFFDFIVPIVPVIDSRNSEHKLFEFFKNSDNAPEKHLLNKIGLYIDDMRLLKNIVNEYNVYSKIIPIKDLNLDFNKLFSLMVLKNIFPNEFDALQEDRGYIFNIFASVEKYREKLKKELLSDIHNTELILNRTFEAMASVIHSNVQVDGDINVPWSQYLEKWSENEKELRSISYDQTRGDFTYEQFLNKFVNPYFTSLDIKKRKLESKIKTLNIRSIKQILLDLSMEERDRVFENDKSIIATNHYVPLIKVLILEGLIDETYWHYKGYFYEASLGKNDQIYLKNLLEGKSQDELLDLENVNEVFGRMTIDDFTRANSLNKSLLEYCISNKNNKETVNITRSSVENNMGKELIDTIESLQTGLKKAYSIILFHEDDGILENVLNTARDANLQEYRYILLSIYSQKEASVERLSKYNKFIENDFEILLYLDDFEKDEFFKNVVSSDVYFTDITNKKVGLDILKDVERTKTYNLSVGNVRSIVKRILGKDDDSVLLAIIYSEPLIKATKEYVDINYEIFISEYINDVEPSIDFKNDETQLLKIINSGIANEKKLSYLGRNIMCIYDLQKIDNLKEVINSGLIDVLLEKKLVPFTKENLLSYKQSIAEYYSAEFIQYFSDQVSAATNEVLNDVLEHNNICDELIQSETMSGITFNRMIHYLSKGIEKIKETLSEERCIQLINAGAIEVNLYNAQVLIKSSYIKAILSLMKQKSETSLLELIEDDQETLSMLTNDIIYGLLDEGADEDDVIKLVRLSEISIEASNIGYEKKKMLLYILENDMNTSDVDYMLLNFGNLPVKHELIEYMEVESVIKDLRNEQLTDEIVQFMLSSEHVSEENKLFVLENKINSKIKIEVLVKYLLLVPEVLELADVFDGKYPLIDSYEKTRITEALIKNKYVKSRKGNRVQQNKSLI